MDNPDDSAQLSGDGGPRTTYACDICRKRKTKCSGEVPCSYCVRHGLECLYTYVKKKRAAYKKSSKLDMSREVSQTMDRFNDRLGYLQQKLTQLTDRVDKLAQSVDSGLPKVPKDMEGDVEKVIDRSTSTSIFTAGALKWLSAATGPNYKIIQPVIKTHYDLLTMITKTIKQDFNPAGPNDRIVADNMLTVKFLFDMLTRFSSQSVWISPQILELIAGKFFSSQPLNDSEKLALNTAVCLACVFVSSAIIEAEGNPGSVPSPHAKSQVRNISREELARLEKACFRNCFYYFHQVAKNPEGVISVAAVLMLFLYLNSTCFYRCNLFVLNIAYKLILRLGYHKIDFLDQDHLDDEAMTDITGKGVLWLKCYLYDHEFSSVLDTPPITSNTPYLNEISFLRIAKSCLRRFFRKHPEFHDSLSPQLARIRYTENAILDPKEFLQIIDQFSRVSANGIGLLVFYYAFSLVKILSKHSKLIYLNHTYRVLESSSKPVVADKSLVESVHSTLGEINLLHQKFQAWEKIAPANISPGAEIDLTMYCYDQDKIGESPPPKKRKIVNSADDNILLGGYNIKVSDRSPLVTNRGFVMVVQFSYYFNCMKVNKIGYRSCVGLYKLLAENDPERLLLAEKITHYEKKYLESARKMLGVSFRFLDDNSRLIYWGVNNVIAAFHAVFINIIGKTNLEEKTPVLPETLPELIEHLYLLIEVHFRYSTKSLSRSLGIEHRYLWTFTLCSIQLCIANMIAKYNCSFVNDLMVQKFLLTIADGDDVSVSSSNTMLQTSLKLDNVFTMQQPVNNAFPPVEPFPPTIGTDSFFTIHDQFSGSQDLPQFQPQFPQPAGYNTMPHVRMNMPNYIGTAWEMNQFAVGPDGAPAISLPIYDHTAFQDNVVMTLGELDPFSFGGSLFNENDFSYHSLS